MDEAELPSLDEGEAGEASFLSAKLPGLGFVDESLSEEFPGLALRYLHVPQGWSKSSRELKERLGDISNRFTGQHAINLRKQPVPWAYRVFFRHIGLDPDEDRTPVEEMALERMRRGGFRSQNVIDDGITIATMECGVAMRAFDAEMIHGRLGIRPSVAGDRLVLKAEAPELQPGTLVIADDVGPVGMLFGEDGEGRGIRKRKTEQVMLCAIQVKGVPELVIEEALWLAQNAIVGGRR